MSKNKNKYIILTLTVLVITIIVVIIQYNRPDPPYTRYKMELPTVILNNDDSEIEKWIIPALKLGEGLDEEFIDKHVYINYMNLFGNEEVTSMDFSIYYVLDQKPIQRSYVINAGTVHVATNVIDKPNAVHLLPITTFIELIKTSDKDKIKGFSGITSRISVILMHSILRLDEAELSDDTQVFYGNQFVSFGDIKQLDNIGVSHILFGGVSRGAVLPFIFSLK